MSLPISIDIKGALVRFRRTAILLSALAATTGGLAVTASSASASAIGCNGAVCIEIQGKGTHVKSVRAYKRSYIPPYKGHYRIFWGNYGINGKDEWGPPELKIQPNRDLPDGTKVCAEGWTYRKGHWDLTGRPCKTIHK